MEHSPWIPFGVFNSVITINMSGSVRSTRTMPRLIQSKRRPMTCANRPASCYLVLA